LETTVITVRDAGFGTHSALHTSNNNFLYDPAGGFPHSEMGSGDFVEGVSLAEYVNYHLEKGSTIELAFLPTSTAQELNIQDRAIEQGGAIGGFCTVATSNALGGVFGIPQGVYFPGNLANSAREAATRSQ